jgi:hypothetical protein
VLFQDLGKTIEVKNLRSVEKAGVQEATVDEDNTRQYQTKPRQDETRQGMTRRDGREKGRTTVLAVEEGGEVANPETFEE